MSVGGADTVICILFVTGLIDIVVVLAGPASVFVPTKLILFVLTLKSRKGFSLLPNITFELPGIRG